MQLLILMKVVKKCLRIENAESYTFITLPNLFQISFSKQEYKNLINKEEIFVKEYVNQPQITYTINSCGTK